MLTVRCTAKLLRRLKVNPPTSGEASSNRLGDWYATILPVRPAHLILLVNEATRLAAVLPARETSTLERRIPEAVLEVLRELGASGAVLDSERHEMAELRFDRTASRSLLGTMNDFSFLMDWGRSRDGAPHDLLRLAMDLNRTPVEPLKYDRLDDVARRILGIEGAPHLA